MADTYHYEARGNWLLKILIVVLIVVLVASVLYPQRLWDKQDALVEASRDRMDNLNRIIQRHYDVHESYVADLDSLMRFIENDSIEVEMARFEIDKLSLYDAGYDSFLVDFADKFHFDRIEVDPFADGAPVSEGNVESTLVDSLILVMQPKDEFVDVVPPVRYAFFSDTTGQGIYYYWPKKGEQDKSLMVWGDGLLQREYLPYDSVRVPSKDYILFLPVDQLRTDPITGEPYQLNLNTRLTMEGNIDFNRVRRGEPDSLRVVAGRELYTNLFVNKLARSARAQLETDMQKDTTLYERQLELQGQYFDVQLETFKPGETISVEANTEVRVPVDSVASYEDINRLRDMLYKVQYDSLIRIWTNLDLTQQIIGELQYTETIEVTGVDTIGVTIRPLMGEEYDLPNDSFLDGLFSVGPIENPGNIENNDLSWSETR